MVLPVKHKVSLFCQDLHVYILSRVNVLESFQELTTPRWM